MSEEPTQEVELNDPNMDEADRSFLEMQKLFEEMSFRERWHKMVTGLKMPHDTGEYKFAGCSCSACPRRSRRCSCR